MAGKDMTGLVFGELTVIERAGVSSNRTWTWLVECTCGRRRVVRGEHLRSGHTTTCDHAHRPTYYGLHARIRRERGLASDYECASEGCDSPATDWAYIEESEEELVDDGLRYTQDVNAYRPMCRSHHALMDIARRLGPTCSQGHLRSEHEARDCYGWRFCRACKRERQAAYQARRAEPSVDA